MSCSRYLKEFSLAMGIYIITVVLSSMAAGSLEPGLWRTLVAVVPIIPILGVAFVVVRQLRRLDELAQKIQLEALGMAFVATAVLTFSYGFLETAGYPRLSMFYVWPLMGMFWLFGTLWGSRRYR